MLRSKIFNVGLHRSGTQSFHDFCTRAGFRSHHWPGYEFDERCRSALESLDTQFVWEQYRPIVEANEAFADLPMPLLYDEAARDYPDALFVLFMRSPKSWIASIRRHTSARALDVLEHFQYWKICADRRMHTADYSDDELEYGYRSHIASVVSVLSRRRSLLALLNLDDPSIGEQLRAFTGVRDPSIGLSRIS